MGKNSYGKNYKKGKGNKGGRDVGSPIKGGKIKASHILVPKLTKAQEIYDKLKAGENFQKIAQENSECSSRRKGGNLGEFSKSDMVPEFWNACAKLKIGELSQPVKSKFGYHIIKRTG